jgi:hypothetical protein
MIAGINEILSENSGVITALGSGKIYPLVVPAEVQPPFIATFLAKSGSQEVKEAVSGIDYRTVAINIHASDYDSLDSVESALISALDGINATTSTNHTFLRIWFLNAFDRPDLFTTERPLYARTVQFNCIVKR